MPTADIIQDLKRAEEAMEAALVPLNKENVKKTVVEMDHFLEEIKKTYGL